MIERISGSEIANGTVDLAYFHFAVLRPLKTRIKLASCVTFHPPSRVPPGVTYNVSQNLTQKMILK